MALVCAARSVWATDSNALLVHESLSAQVFRMPGLRLEGVRAHWREGIPGAPEEVPHLLQLRADHLIHTSSLSVDPERCSCGSVRAVSFEPLIVLDNYERAAIWYLAESPDVLIVNHDLRSILVTADPDLEFAEVEVEEANGP